MEEVEKEKPPLAGVAVEGVALPLTFKWGFEEWQQCEATKMNLIQTMKRSHFIWGFVGPPTVA